MKSAIVVVLDRLGSGYLGPYGNTWIDTPGLNRWASQSSLFDSAIADGPSLAAAYQSYWRGIPSFVEDPTSTVDDPAMDASLLGQLAAAGRRTTLVTDCPWVSQHPLAADFSDRVEMLDTPLPSIASEVGETQVGQLLAAAWEQCATGDRPSLLWLHARAGSVWDAPSNLRHQFTEEGDPPPADCVDPPDEVVGGNVDPDRLLAFSHAYAGQVVAIDNCLGVFLQALEELPVDRQPLLILASPRGFALGEHGRIGACGDGTYSEVIQLPLLIREPGDVQAGTRIPHLVQPVDLYTTLLRYFGLPQPTDEPSWGHDLLATIDQSPRQYACTLHSDCWSLRTPIWFLRDTDPRELFVKPDDRWEVNEVADRCTDIVSELQSALEKIRQAARVGDATAMPELVPEVVDEELARQL